MSEERKWRSQIHRASSVLEVEELIATIAVEEVSLMYPNIDLYYACINSIVLVETPLFLSSVFSACFSFLTLFV